MGHKASNAVADIGAGEIDARGLGGAVFLGVLEETPDGGESSGGAHGGENGFGGGRTVVSGGEAGDDEKDEEFPDLGPSSHGDI